MTPTAYLIQIIGVEDCVVIYDYHPTLFLLFQVDDEIDLSSLRGSGIAEGEVPLPEDASVTVPVALPPFDEGVVSQVGRDISLFLSLSSLSLYYSLFFSLLSLSLSVPLTLCIICPFSWKRWASRTTRA